MFGRDPDTPGFESAKQMADDKYADIIVLIRHGQDQGCIRDGDPLIFARTGWATVHGLAELTLGRQIELRDAEEALKAAEASMDVFVAGISKR